MPPAKTSILIYGRDPQLLETRRLVLERSGARVWAAAEPSDFDKVTPTDSVDLLVLCHSLSAEQCGHALVLAKARWNHMQSLFLVSGLCRCHQEEAEHVVNVNLGPAYFLNAVAKLLQIKTPGNLTPHHRIGDSHGAIRRNGTVV